MADSFLPSTIYKKTIDKSQKLYYSYKNILLHINKKSIYIFLFLYIDLVGFYNNNIFEHKSFIKEDGNE